MAFSFYLFSFYAVRLAVTGKIVYRYQPNMVRNSVVRNESAERMSCYENNQTYHYRWRIPL
nr:MAG TPA: hypothetical protein [Caudoviricetes sp.]